MRVCNIYIWNVALYLEHCHYPGILLLESPCSLVRSSVGYRKRSHQRYMHHTYMRASDMCIIHTGIRVKDRLADNFPPDNCPPDKFPLGGTCPKGNLSGGTCPGGSLPGRGTCPGGSCPKGNLSAVKLSGIHKRKCTFLTRHITQPCARRAHRNPPTNIYSPNVGSLYPIQVYI